MIVVAVGMTTLVILALTALGFYDGGIGPLQIGVTAAAVLCVGTPPTIVAAALRPSKGRAR